MIKLRPKRETQTIYAKNQYESVLQNVNTTDSDGKKIVETATSNISSVVVPFSASDRKDEGIKLTQEKTTTVQPTLGVVNGSLEAKKQEVNGSDELIETPEEKLIDNVDVPDNETISKIENTNYTVNSTNVSRSLRKYFGLFILSNYSIGSSHLLQQLNLCRPG